MIPLWQSIMEQLSAACPGQVLRLMGGAARDIAHKVEPYDLDIVVLRGENPLYIHAALIYLGYELTALDEQSGDYATGPGESDFGLCWKSVAQFAREGCPDIDVLVSDYGNAVELSKHFDFNINQYAMSWLDGRLIMGPAFLGEDEKELFQLDGSVVIAERREYIINKASALGWHVSEETRNGN